LKEYKVIDFSTNIPEKIENTLNEYCNNGWEVVSINFGSTYNGIIAFVTFVRVQ
jgi:hypothetical protein